MTEEWKNKREPFEVLDGREMAENFLPIVLKKAEKVTVGEGVCVVQSFEPMTEKISDDEYRAYFYRTERKYLLSLANAVGAGRLRQAIRELVKAYAAGATVAELDDLFSLFVWNQGIGNF
ncbi:hypothetical protein C5S30_01440 [ANME-1 cluster archaeon GoMg4]|nr:hypothetical protein [ANME-1 cluster archaeon GoMg4]